MSKNSAKRAPVEKPPVVLKQKMAKPISAYTDPAALRTLMQNAKRMGRDDIWAEAFLRLCSLEGAEQTDPLHRDFHEMLAAYEQLLSEKNGRATRASRTRMKLKAKGVVASLEDLVKSEEPTEGFELLVASNFVGDDRRADRAEVFRPVFAGSGRCCQDTTWGCGACYRGLATRGGWSGMILIGVNRSAYTRRVAITLKAYGLQYEQRDVCRFRQSRGGTGRQSARAHSCARARQWRDAGRQRRHRRPS